MGRTAEKGKWKGEENELLKKRFGGTTKWAEKRASNPFNNTN